MKQLSIIIPHFNSVKLLEKLLLSIPKYDDIEIIVIDDNSTEGINKLNKIKESLEFEHVTFLLNNTGIQSAGACRNVGLEAATGKWILFADSDDYFLTDFYKFISSYFQSNYDVVFFKTTSIYIDTNEKSNRHIKYEKLLNDYLYSNSFEHETKLRFQYGTPWSKLIKKELIDNNNIVFDEVIAWNDMMFSTKVGYYMKLFAVDPATIYCVTRSKGSLTTKISEEVIDSRIDTFIRYCNFAKNNITKSQRKYLNLNGLGKLIMVFKSGLGLSKVWSINKKFRRNNIKLIDRNYLNPLFIVRRVVAYIQNHNKEKKYYVE